MAKAKADKAKPGPKPKPPGEATPAQMVLSIKMRPEFHAWLSELAEHKRITLVQIFDQAVVDYAKREGFTKPAPKRTIR